MEWSAEQTRALKSVADWFHSSDQQVFRLFGYAGTGKTTLAKHFAENISGVLFAAFTGKAAYVMRQKGCFGATTIHKLIYHPRDKSSALLKEMIEKLDELKMLLKEEFPDPKPGDNIEIDKLVAEIKAEKKNLKRPAFTLDIDSPVGCAPLVIIDECSMVGQEMAQDLLSFNTKVLVLGDPGQLPPVASTGFFINNEPDFLLGEIHRQARDNPIIELAHQVRNRKELTIGDYGDSKVIAWGTVNSEMALSADQIIVGTNKLRRGTNARMRQLLDRNGTPYPIAGDRLVCLRNNHDIGLLNGSLWETLDCRYNDEYLELAVRPEEGGSQIDCSGHSEIFEGVELPWWDRKKAEEFDFGYALTCHKSQGSQWDEVLVFDQSYTFREFRHKWLYTAITRAAERVIIVV